MITYFIVNDIVEKKVALAKEHYSIQNSIYYANIACVFGETSEGKVLCNLHNKKNSVGNILYLFEPKSGKGSILVEGQKPIIYSAQINQEWVVWVERDKYKWDIKAKNLKTGKITLINSGYYINLVGDDYPTVTLSKNRVIYDTSLIDQNKKVYSSIKVYDLDNNKEWTIVNNYNAPEQYLGHVKSNNDYVVWHTGICDFVKYHEKGLLYIYNIESGHLKRVSADEYCFTPVLSKEFLIYTKKKPEHTETANIVLLNLSNNQEITLTNATKENYLEFWAPSTNGKYVTWSNNLGRPLEVYDIQQGKTIIIGKGYEKVCNITGKWLTWVPGDKERGICFLDLNDLYN